MRERIAAAGVSSRVPSCPGSPTPKWAPRTGSRDRSWEPARAVADDGHGIARRRTAGAAAIAAIVAFAAGVVVIARHPPADGEGFGVFVLGTAVLGAAGGGAAAVERIIRASTLPDPLVELVVAAIGFIGGAMLGAGVGVFLAAISSPRIA